MGNKVKILFKNVVRLETKGDKTENRVLVSFYELFPALMFIWTLPFPVFFLFTLWSKINNRVNLNFPPGYSDICVYQHWQYCLIVIMRHSSVQLLYTRAQAQDKYKTILTNYYFFVTYRKYV